MLAVCWQIDNWFWHLIKFLLQIHSNQCLQ